MSKYRGRQKTDERNRGNFMEREKAVIAGKCGDIGIARNL
jgi:hypothetical protein